MKDALLSEINRVLPKLVKMRRDIHAHPELAFEEERTSQVGARYFKALGLEVTRGLAKTGVVALLRGRLSGPTLAVRAELDAVPIQERSNLPHASKTPGVMHACGHDGHLAILMGAAKIFCLLKDRLRGNVKFLLQPADEGRGGARALLEAGVLSDSPAVDALLGVHCSPEIPLGRLALMDGADGTMIDSFRIRIVGKGGHPAFPQTVNDPIFLSAQVINALQSLTGRFGNSAITLSRIGGGSAPNVIPNSVEIEGTVRFNNPNYRDPLREAMESLISGVCAAYGGRCRVTYEAGAPMPRHDPDLARHIVVGAESVRGSDFLQPFEHPALGTEEFSTFLDTIPGAMCLLGITPPEGEVVPLHNPHFDFNDQALVPGIQVVVGTALSFLNGDARLP